MARILFASELGGNLGHIGQLLPLASELRERGHEVVFAVRDVTRADLLLRAHRFRCLQAPVWHARAQSGAAMPCSYSEILQYYGYRDAQGLLGLIAAWRELYSFVDPRVVLCEFAPTALLACRGLDVSRVQYGVGFSVPPRVSPMPSFRTWENISAERLDASDAAVLDTVNAALGRLAIQPLGSIADLLAAEADFLCTFRELDHYRERPDARYSGAIYTADEGAKPVWPDNGTQRVFVYLRAGSPMFERTARALADLGCNVLWIAPSVSESARKRYESARFVFSRVPVRLGEAAACADVAVLHGGHGTVAAMLLGGVPLMLYPEHAEQGIVTRNVTDTGAGIGVTADRLDETGKVLTALLLQPDYKAAAAAFAARYKGYDPVSSVRRIADELGSRCGL
jgi:UDP:flavonoid glycosyltransferase YjiC (YdhE family)